MGGGPPCFPQGFTCLVVLWIRTDYHNLSLTGLLPSTVQLSSCVQLTMIFSFMFCPQPQRINSLVWALSFSLAATKKIDFSFSSSRYLDVSVPWVYLHKAIYSLYDTWGFPCEFPHSEIFGSLTMCVYPKLIAAYRVLHRLLMPRHSPYALCSLTCSRDTKVSHCVDRFMCHWF